MTTPGQGSLPAAEPATGAACDAAPSGAGSVGAAGHAALTALRHRLELTALEAAEARDHAVATALLLSAAAVLGVAAGFALNLLLLVLVWNQPWRGFALAGLFLAEGLTGALCLAAVRARLRRWRPFGELSEQLRQDALCLERLTEPFAR